MYHSISTTLSGARHPYYETVTTPEAFASHMRFLHENGYSVLDLAEAVSRLQNPAQPFGRTAVITFDDGFHNFYTTAFPILNKYSFGATVFLPTAFIGKSARQFKDIECMTWNQVRESRKAGIRFGSHSVTHPRLKTLPMRDVRDEIHSSKQTIEHELGESIDSFAYPFAFPQEDMAFTSALRGILRESGYRHGVSTIIGAATPTNERFFLPRLPVNAHDGAKLFQAKVNGGYDWVHAVQYASRLSGKYAPRAFS